MARKVTPVGFILVVLLILTAAALIGKRIYENFFAELTVTKEVKLPITNFQQKVSELTATGATTLNNIRIQGLGRNNMWSDITEAKLDSGSVSVTFTLAPNAIKPVLRKAAPKNFIENTQAQMPIALKDLGDTIQINNLNTSNFGQLSTSAPKNVRIMFDLS